jgi:hypothetical protein
MRPPVLGGEEGQTYEEQANPGRIGRKIPAIPNKIDAQPAIRIVTRRNLRVGKFIGNSPLR